MKTSWPPHASTCGPPPRVPERALSAKLRPVFRHHHHPESVAARIDRLMAAVFVQNDTERMAQLAPHLAPDFVFVTPSAVVDGVQGLSDAFSHYRHDAQLETALRRTSAVDVHHTYLRYSWERGGVVMAGWSFGQVDGEGRLMRIVSFDGLVPGSESAKGSDD